MPKKLEKQRKNGRILDKKYLMARQPGLEICYVANFNVMKIPSAGKNTLWRENTLWRDPLWRDFTVFCQESPITFFGIRCTSVSIVLEKFGMG